MWLLMLAAQAMTALDLNALPPSPPPEAYIHASDRERARRSDPDDIPCTRRGMTDGLATLESLPVDQCYRMFPARRMTGVWIDGFEESLFFPGVRHAPLDEKGPRIWLETQRVRVRHGFATGGKNGRAVLLTFIGRQTRYAGHYGHMGLFDQVIVVDRLISARDCLNSVGAFGPITAVGRPLWRVVNVRRRNPYGSGQLRSGP